MKKILLFLFFNLLSFSQENKLTVNQIDSIVKTIRPKIESSGLIKENRKTIGGFDKTTYELEQKLIYSYYYESTKDKEYEFFHLYEFYFFNEKPIFIKLNVEKTNIKDNSNEVFKVELNEMESTSFKEIKNPFLINLRMKLNRIIFDFLNYKLPE